MGPLAKFWILHLFNNILSFNSLPKLFKKTKVIAILKPGKDGSDAAHYRPISLLCVPFKLLERLILNRIQDRIDTILPKTQAGFRQNRGCAEQVLALTTHIEKGF